MRAIFGNKNLSETEKFRDIVDFQKNESKKLRDCLDGLSRSNMIPHMVLMKRYRMISQDDIEEFSEELQKFLQEFERIYLG
jgi:restriction endonuclease